ncbi:uncharacterized protein CDAR_542631 [Caerostris darwini]|uniref:Gustatory receptor n=1 Tax=Caerostris darwini TaxID=1538125 RepID=A0AAV4RLV1_9ARAC|nr:hypothetical protein CDAR_532921 [Caerostris darwini]GIY57803.1 uncharacterized protein CDAR_542631 [Caerostris darwini]
MQTIPLHKMKITPKKFSEEIFEADSMKPILLLFVVNGISIRSRTTKKALFHLLSVTFHMLWFLATIANFWCLNDLFYSIHIFTIIARAIALITWWTIRYKRKALKDLLMFLKFMFKNLKLQTNLSSRILIKSSPWLMLVISFLPVLMWMTISTPQLDNCELFWATVQPDILYLCIYFFLLSLQQYINWCIPFSVGLFYVCYCKELSRVIKKLTVSLKAGELSNVEVRKYYRILIKLIVKLDAALSLPVLLCLIRCFMEFFRALTMYFQYSKDMHEIKYIVNAVFYTFESSVLYVAVVLFADKLQLDCNVLRKSLLRHPDIHSGRNTWKAIEKCSQLFEDKEDIKLTAWKMLRLKKKVLFTTATSLLTYGIILHQFHP